jgi:transcriptional regulator with XRE-family HTH domain
MTLGSAIRERRIELGLTQEALAQRIGDGVRQAEVSRLESDRIILPRRRRLERIANALGFTIGELLARSRWTDANQADTNPDRQQPRRAHVKVPVGNKSSSRDGATPHGGQSRRLRIDRTLVGELSLEDRRVHAKWFDLPTHDGDTPTISFSDHPDPVCLSLSLSGPDREESATAIESDDHVARAIPLVIDRLTAAILETATLRRSIIAKTTDPSEMVDELRAIEESLKGAGVILHRLQEQPCEAAAVLTPQPPD